MKGGYLMSITKHHLSIFEYITNEYTTNLKTIIEFIILSVIFLVLISFLIMIITKIKTVSIILALPFAIILSIFCTSSAFENRDYYSINGSAKITDVKSYSTNGNSNDNNTQTVYFTYKDHIYNVQSPNNKIVKKGDTIQFKSSKYAAIIDNGTISKADDLKNQNFDINIISK